MGSSTFKFRLYIAGKNKRSEQAIEILERMCREELDGECETEIVDVMEHPDLAERDRIMATPVLIKKEPAPSRRIVGDLTDLKEVLGHLDLLAFRKADGARKESDQLYGLEKKGSGQD